MFRNRKLTDASRNRPSRQATTRSRAAKHFSRRLSLEWLEERRYLDVQLPAYLVSEIGDSSGLATTIPLSINNKGQVVGFTLTPTMTGNVERPILYENGVVTDLGLPVGKVSGVATAINDNGMLIGCAFLLDRQSSGFMGLDGTLIDIGNLNGGLGATVQANGLNASGQIVGYSSVGGTLTAVHAMLLSNGVMQDLGVLPTGTNSQALGINASGMIAGWSGVAAASQSPTTHAVLWSDGVMQDLGTLPGGTLSLAQVINASGTVAGFATTADGIYHAMMMKRGGTMQDLGTLPGAVSSFASGINDSGQVIGGSKTLTGEIRPFLYTGGIMVGLNSLIPDATDWELNTALGINNFGQIVGQGIHNGREAAYLLTPVNYAGVITTEPPAKVLLPNLQFSLTVSAFNAQGKVDPAYNGAITVAIASGPDGATLSGTTTRTAVNGVVNFAGLKLSKAGTYTLEASGPFLAPAQTRVFNVTVPSAPTNLVPGPQSAIRSTVNPSGTLLFSLKSGNAIEVSSPAVTSGDMELKLSVGKGTLKLATTANVTIVKGADLSPTVTIRGTSAAINMALRGLAYVPNPLFTGTETLTLLSSDLGHTALGTPLTKSSQVPIQVSPVKVAVGYTITDLGTLPGGTSSYGISINAAGEVAGWSTTIHGDWHAVLYSGGVMRDLGTLNGAPYSFATGLNDSGQVVGWNLQTVGLIQSFLFDGTEMANLPLAANPLGLVNKAIAINNRGQVVGTSNTSSGAGPYAYLYGNGTTTSLGTLPGGIQSEAIGINAAGQVIGASYGSNGLPRAFLYRNGAMIDLGTLPGGTRSQAVAINTAGQVVGNSTVADGSQRAFLYKNGAMQDLGTPFGALDSEANGINTWGQIVGSATMVGGGEHAWAYRDGVMQDLNALVLPWSGWVLTTANGINAAGQIVGHGIVNGEVHAFILTPVSAAAAKLGAPNVTSASTTQNVQTTSGLVITPNAADVGVVLFFRISGITGGTLFLNDGVTPVNNGAFITVAQAALGLKFTPDSTAAGSFLIQPSLNGNVSGLGATSATAKITVAPAATQSALSSRAKILQPLATLGLAR